MADESDLQTLLYVRHKILREIDELTVDEVERELDPEEVIRITRRAKLEGILYLESLMKNKGWQNDQTDVAKYGKEIFELEDSLPEE